MKIVITGGAGFIGSHVTELFCDEGHDVTVIDDLRFGYKKFVDKRARFVKIPLQDVKKLTKALKNVDLVIHLAASSIISRSITHPKEYFENNLSAGLLLLEAMRINNVHKIIYSSTASVYGEPRRIPVKENDETRPLTSYGASKLAFENALSAYYYTYGIRSVSLRYYNAYGPRDEQLPRTRAIPMWIEAALKNKPIPWYWNGGQFRDYVYVKDIAIAHKAVLKLDGYYVFNVGSGVPIQMKKMLHHLEKVVGRKLKTKDLGERQGDPKKLVSDISLIKKTVNWQPQTALEAGLNETYDYYRSQFSHD